MRIIFSILILLSIAGCTQLQLEHSAMSYNKAIAEYGNQEILLNAVRASKRHPLYFSQVSSISGQPRVSGAIKSDFGFSPFKLLGYGVDPSTSFQAGFSNANISQLDSEDFNKAILDPVEVKLILNNFTKKGWPIDVATLMFVQKVEIPEKSLGGLTSNLKHVCENQIETRFGDTNLYCDLLRNTTVICGQKKGFKRFFKNGIPFVRLDNDPEDQCEFLRFRDFAFLLRFSETKFHINTKGAGQSKKVIKQIKRIGVDPETGREINYTEEVTEFSDKQGTETLDAEIYSYEKKRMVQLRDPKLGGPKVGIDIVIRAPDGLIYYLGEIIRVQLRDNDKRYIPQIITTDGVLAPLFWIKKGVSAFGSGEVSVQHAHESYYIPSEKYKGKSHRSMQAVTLVKQIFDLKSSNKNQPRDPVTFLQVGN